MQNERRLRTIHANANEHEGYWQVRVSVDAMDRKTLEEETVTWRKPVDVPDVQSDLDQAWVVLVTMIHLLEEEGAIGRIAAADWPPLF